MWSVWPTMTTMSGTPSCVFLKGVCWFEVVCQLPGQIDKRSLRSERDRSRRLHLRCLMRGYDGILWWWLPSNDATTNIEPRHVTLHCGWEHTCGPYVGAFDQGLGQLHARPVSFLFLFYIIFSGDIWSRTWTATRPVSAVFSCYFGIAWKLKVSALDVWLPVSFVSAPSHMHRRWIW